MSLVESKGKVDSFAMKQTMKRKGFRTPGALIGLKT
jgi:hypothetical protein